MFRKTIKEHTTQLINQWATLRQRKSGTETFEFIIVHFVLKSNNEMWLIVENNLFTIIHVKFFIYGYSNVIIFEIQH